MFAALYKLAADRPAQESGCAGDKIHGVGILVFIHDGDLL